MSQAAFADAAAASKEDPIEMEKVVVAERAGSTESAFTDKAAADSLTEVLSGAALSAPTAQSASDLVKGASGVSVGKAPDGGTEVTIRGVDSKLNQVTVDGQGQSHSGNFKGGGNAMDSIPPEMVKSVEVTKALTPDMDADAIGGAINLTTESAADLKGVIVRGRNLVTSNSLRPQALGSRDSVSVGTPFGVFSKKPDAGIFLTLSYDDVFKPRENVETDRFWPTIVSPGPAPYAGVPIPAYTQSRLEQTFDHQRRAALVFNADLRVGEATSLYFRSNISHDVYDRMRNQARFDDATGTPLALTPDYGVFSGVTLYRRAIQLSTSRDQSTLGVGGKTIIGRAEISAAAGYNLVDDKEPRTLDAFFGSDQTYQTTYLLHPDPYLPRISFVDEANPANTANLLDPSHYLFKNFTITHGDGKETGTSANIDVKLDVGSSGKPAFVKFGAKIQRRHRTVVQDRAVYDPGATPFSMAGLTADAAYTTLHGGGYHYGPIPDAGAVSSLLSRSPSLFQLNATDTLLGSQGADFDATETIGAAYAMAKATWGNWTLLGGARIEGTRVTTRANQFIYAPSGAVQGIMPVSAHNRYTLIMPGVHLRFDPRPDLILRASLTYSLARPAYSLIAPTQDISFETATLNSGNPALKPYKATNYDLSADKLDARYGMLTAAVFYKEIADYIVEYHRLVSLGDLGEFEQTQNVNGSAARIWGLETGWRSLPAALGYGLGNASIGLTYNFTRSEARLPDRPGEIVPMPRQADHQVNFTLSDEIGPLTCDLSLIWHSDALLELDGPGRDRYERGGTDADLNLAFKLSKQVQLTAGIANLLRLPQQSYHGNPSLLGEREDSGMLFTAGLKWKL